MILIVGLGNPGKKFDNTPHNIGFKVLDIFAKENSFPDFKLHKKSNALISKKDDIILAKPQTFMNNSGVSVKNLVRSDLTKFLVVIHDDIDLLVGKIKIVKGRGSAGHKGVESIIKAIGNKNLIRIRVGVMPAEGKPDEAKEFVLKRVKIPDEVVLTAAKAVESLIKNGVEKAMAEFNK